MARRWTTFLLLVISAVVGCGGEQVLGEVEGSPVPVCDPSYTSRLRVEIDARPFTEPLADFPVLVTLSPSSFDYEAVGSEGEGLSFVLPDCQLLAHEIDRWEVGGTSHVWVSVPLIEPGAVRDIFLFYGQEDPVQRATSNEVFTEDFVAVYHLEDASLADASAYRRAGANRSAVLDDGWVGNGRLFDANSSIAIPDGAFSEGLAPRTACVWARSDNDGAAWYWFFAHGTGSNAQGGFALNRHGTQLECLGGDGSRSVLRGVFAAGDRSWRYVCCSYDGTDATLWADGVPLLIEERNWPIGLATGQIGSSVMPDNTGNSSWDGALDELRVSSVARSADWIAAEYASMTGRLVRLVAVDRP